MDLQGAPAEKRPKNNFISKVNRSMYLDEKTADVHFTCGTEGERIPAHKCILSKASPYFDAMFYGPNKSECDKDYAKWSPDAFKDFLKLCYLDEVVIGPNNVVNVMELAHESQMFESLKLCGELWADYMTTDDVCRAYHWAIHFEMDDFKEFCERKISAYTKQVFKTSDFLSCDRVVLNHILELDTLLCKEKTVLQACLNWASKACERDDLDSSELKNLRIYLKDSLYKVRYKSMTTKEFCEVMDSKVGHFFDIDDYEDIIRITTGESDLRTGHFNSKPRSSEIAWRENRAIECNLFNRLKLSEQIIRNGDPQEVTLKSPQLILLGGFRCAPFGKYGPKASVTITQKSSTPMIIHTAVIDLKNEIESCLDLSKNPILLRPEFEYGISFKFSTCYREIYYNASSYDRVIKLNGKATIELPKSGDHNIVRGFKFNLF